MFCNPHQYHKSSIHAGFSARCGINLAMTATGGGVSIPVAFEVLGNPLRFCDPVARQRKRGSLTTKSEQRARPDPDVLHGEENVISSSENSDAALQKHIRIRSHPEQMRGMIAVGTANQLKFRYVLLDSWYAVQEDSHCKNEKSFHHGVSPSAGGVERGGKRLAAVSTPIHSINLNEMKSFDFGLRATL